MRIEIFYAQTNFRNFFLQNYNNKSPKRFVIFYKKVEFEHI